MYTNLGKNEAVEQEKNRIREVFKSIHNIDIDDFEYEFEIRNTIGYITHGWLIFKYPAKGNYKITQFFKNEGYECRSEKVVAGRNFTSSLIVKIVAEKEVKFAL